MQSLLIAIYVVSSNPAQTRCTRYNSMWTNLSVTCAGRWFSQGTPISSTNKTDRHDICEILLKVTLNTITVTPLFFLYHISFQSTVLSPVIIGYSPLITCPLYSIYNLNVEWHFVIFIRQNINVRSWPYPWKNYNWRVNRWYDLQIYYITIVHLYIIQCT
jgi:hypothetical protein